MDAFEIPIGSVIRGLWSQACNGTPDALPMNIANA